MYYKLHINKLIEIVEILKCKFKQLKICLVFNYRRRIIIYSHHYYFIRKIPDLLELALSHISKLKPSRASTST